MDRRAALKLAIAALQVVYKQWLYASDSEASDKKRIEIAQAIETLDGLRRQKEMKL